MSEMKNQVSTRSAPVELSDCDGPPSANKNQIPIFRNRWLLSILIVTLFVSLCYGLVGLPFYATNDDACMTAIVSGTAYVDSPDEHTLFSHAYQGLILKHLYLTLPGIPWYGLFQIATLALSMCVLTWLILGKSRRLSTLLALAFATHIATCTRPLLLMQFTTTSALAACAGTFLLVESIERWHLRKRALLCMLGATTMLALATLVRDDAANLVLLVATILTVSRFFPSLLRQRSKLIAHLLAFAAAFALVFTLNWLNLSYYKNEWKDFFKTNAATLAICEYRCDKSDSPANLSMYRRVGWTPTDAALFQNRYTLDQSTYSLEKLTALAKLLANRTAESFNSDEFMASVGSLLTDQSLIPLVLPFLLLIPLVDRRKVPHTSWLLIAVGILSLCAFLVLSMKLPMRVFVAVMLPMTIFSIRYISPSKIDFSKVAFLTSTRSATKEVKYTIYGILLLGAVAPSLWLMSQLHTQLRFMAMTERALRKATQHLSMHPERLYIDWAGALRTTVSPFADLTEIYRDLKIIPLGAYGHTPYVYKRLREAGITNLLSQLDKENIVVISNERYNRLIRMYAAEKLGKEVILTRVPVKPSTFQAFKVKYVTPADPEKLKRDLSVGFHTD